MSKRAAVIVLSWNGRRFLEACFSSVLKQTYAHYNVLLVDNASQDGSADFVAQRFPTVEVIRNEKNLGFAGGMNVGLRYAEGEILTLLNQDTEVPEGWLAELVKAMGVDEGVGIVGCKILYPDGRTIQHAGGFIDYPLGFGRHYGYREIDEGQYDEKREVDYVTGAAMGLRRSLLGEVGGFDEAFFPAYFEDVDLCLRARSAGYKVVYVPSAVVIHHEATVLGKDSFEQFHAFQRNRLRFLVKHYSLAQLLEEFVPAEREWLEKEASPAELRALERAYLEASLSSPISACGVTEVADEVERSLFLAQAFQSLWKRALERRVAIFGSPANRERLEELQEKRLLKEPGFRSQLPLVGPLIAGFRELWNSVSTKWYVGDIIRQQMGFNDLVSWLMSEEALRAEDAAGEITALASAIALLSSRLDRMEANLDRQLATLQERVEEVEKALGIKLVDEGERGEYRNNKG